VRARFDGEKRNPWDEPECGHHYARAMSSWSTVVAMSGFRYDGPAGAVVAVLKDPRDSFMCFWATGTGWGTYSLRKADGNTQLSIKVLHGGLDCRSCEIAAKGAAASVEMGGRAMKNKVSRRGDRAVVALEEMLRMGEKDELRITVHA